MQESHVTALKQIVHADCKNIDLQIMQDLIDSGLVTADFELTSAGKIVHDLIAQLYLQQIKLDELKSQISMQQGHAR